MFRSFASTAFLLARQANAEFSITCRWAPQPSQELLSAVAAATEGESNAAMSDAPDLLEFS